MNVPWFARVFLLAALVLAGCQPLPQQTAEALPTAEPTIAQTRTATIVWFPATATPTALPTLPVEPTPEQHPGIGELLLEDDFSEQSAWQTARSTVGSVAFGKNELTLAVAQPKGTLLSLREGPVLDDFYLEVTTQASLCRSNDMYGLLLRASSDQDFYRFLVNCNGLLRVERAVNSQLTLVQDWIASGQVPPGSPIVLHIGVWAQGSELRFFIDDIYQFSVTDPVFRSGRIGLFARSTGDTALTVSFSNLSVHEIDPDAEPPAQPETTATPEP